MYSNAHTSSPTPPDCFRNLCILRRSIHAPSRAQRIFSEKYVLPFGTDSTFNDLNVINTMSWYLRYVTFQIPEEGGHSLWQPCLAEEDSLLVAESIPWREINIRIRDSLLPIRNSFEALCSSPKEQPVQNVYMISLMMHRILHVLLREHTQTNKRVGHLSVYSNSTVA